MLKLLINCVCLFLGVLIGCFGFPKNVHAAEPNELQLTTERVIVFKDGYFLVIKRGEAVADAQGQVFTDEVPDAAALGTFWATQEDGKLKSMLAGWSETETEEDLEANCRNTLEVLMANQGEQVTVVTNDNQTFTGIISKILAEKISTPIDRIQLPAAMQSLLKPLEGASTQKTTSATTLSTSLSDLQGSQFILRTQESDLLLSVGNIKTVSIKSMKTSITRTIKTKKKTKRLTLTISSPSQKQVVHLLYFRPGIRWIPTYRVVLNTRAETKTAEVVLQAEILNQAEDLNNVPIDIVVGVPNFRFRDTISPFTLESTMQNVLREAAPQLMGQSSNYLLNSAFAQRSGEFGRDVVLTNDLVNRNSGQVELPNELQAADSQELFVYKLPKVTMAIGERMAVPIFEATCPYRDVYTWDVTLSRQDIEAAPSGSGVASPLVLSKNEVWRQIELTNTTNLPWTTGAAMIMEGQQPLAQELLTYTSPKNPCRVPLTVAIEVKGSYDEKETGRTLNALQWQGSRYAKISKQANLRLRNNKNAPIDVEVSLRLGGRADSATENGVVRLQPFRKEDWGQYSGHPAVNNSSQVTWKFSLKPGEVVTPAVDYHYFAHH